MQKKGAKFMNRKVSQKLSDAANGLVRITQPIVNDVPKLGRNDRCWCNSGAKYKKCCWMIEQDYSQMPDIEMESSPQQDLEDMTTDQLMDILDEGEENA